MLLSYSILFILCLLPTDLSIDLTWLDLAKGKWAQVLLLWFFICSTFSNPFHLQVIINCICSVISRQPLQPHTIFQSNKTWSLVWSSLAVLLCWCFYFFRFQCCDFYKRICFLFPPCDNFPSINSMVRIMFLLQMCDKIKFTYKFNSLPFTFFIPHHHHHNLPLVILRYCTSFSHDAKEAFKTSVSFLFVPGVKGGIWVGTSAKRKTMLSLRIFRPSDQIT